MAIFQVLGGLLQFLGSLLPVLGSLLWFVVSAAAVIIPGWCLCGFAAILVVRLIHLIPNWQDPFGPADREMLSIEGHFGWVVLAGPVGLVIAFMGLVVCLSVYLFNHPSSYLLRAGHWSFDQLNRAATAFAKFIGF